MDGLTTSHPGLDLSRTGLFTSTAVKREAAVTADRVPWVLYTTLGAVTDSIVALTPMLAHYQSSTLRWSRVGSRTSYATTSTAAVRAVQHLGGLDWEPSMAPR